MRRKGAKSIYELSTRPDKGPLLMENGALEALSVLSEVRNHQGRLIVSTVTRSSIVSRQQTISQFLCIQVHHEYIAELGLALSAVGCCIVVSSTKTFVPSMNAIYLFIILQVEDPITLRYAGASYVNIVTLTNYYRREMLKNQVRQFSKQVSVLQ